MRQPTNPVVAAAIAPISRPQPVPLGIAPHASAPPLDSAPRSRPGPSAPPPLDSAPRSRPNAPPPIRASVSQSIPSKPRWGVILVVLVVDLGLAAAGVFMLREGLREVPSTPVGPSPAASSVKAELSPPVKKADPPPPPLPAVEPIAKASDAAPPKDDKEKVADPAPPPDPATATTGAASSTTSPGSRTAQHRVDNAKSTRKKDAKGGPLDPYENGDASFNVGVQVDQIMGKARPAIDACYAEAAKAVPADQVPHGVVKIAFRVPATGHFEHASVIENTTSSEQLAGCLVREVTNWSMPPHTADVVDFVRAFSF